MKVLITTVPFGEKDRRPIDLLESAGIEYLINPLGRKLAEGDLIDLIAEVDVLIAGTETISARVMDAACKLKMISRVGIGLDGIDLNEAQKRDIQVCYTPDAPSPAVADLTIGLMLSLLRYVHVANNSMHRREWKRYFGRRISEVTIGVIGAGRIGQLVLKHLSALGVTRLLVNDLLPISGLNLNHQPESVSKEEIYRRADVISLHVPLTPNNQNMISKKELKKMKSDAFLINTSRGGIVNEDDLCGALMNGQLAGAAVDVFCNEPYSGPLSDVDHCLLTSHMGSMSIDCRTQMEIEATEDAIRFIEGTPLRSPVPQGEYQLQSAGD